MHFDFGRNFSEGLAPVQIGELWGFIDKSGSVVISAKFQDAEPYSSGLARVQEHSLYGYADKSGVIVVPAQYKYAESFSDGFAWLATVLTDSGTSISTVGVQYLGNLRPRAPSLEG
jgi:hypothetical protein